MLKMGAQFTNETYADRSWDCALALAPAFIAVVELAERLGWREDEVASALSTLADNHLHAGSLEAPRGLQRVGLRLVGC